MDLQSELQESFQTRLERLKRELERAIRYDQPLLLLVIYASEWVRAEVERELRQALIALGQRAETVQVDKEHPDIVERILREPERQRTVFFVRGLSYDGAHRALNLRREDFIEGRVRVLFWLTEQEAVRLVEYAPDFWAFRHRVVEFGELPPSSHLAALARELVWPGMDGTVLPGDIPEMIQLRERLLAELPEKDEALAPRAELLFALGTLYAQQGRWEEAVRNYEESLRIKRSLGDRHGEAQALMSLGNLYLQQGRWEEAEGNYERALEVFRALGDRQSEAWTLGNLGIVYLQQGRWEEAEGIYERALEVFRALGDRQSEARTLSNLGIVYRMQGRWEEAKRTYEEALEIFRLLGDRHGEARVRNSLGLVCARQDHWGEAEKAYNEALKVFRALGDRHGEAQTLTNLGNVYLQQGRWGEAEKAHREALGIFRSLGERYGEAQVLMNLGNVYQQQDRWAEAAQNYEQSLLVFQSLIDHTGESLALMALETVRAALSHSEMETLIPSEQANSQSE